MPNGQTSAAKGGGGEAARGARDVVERAVDGWIRERLLEAGCVKVRPQNLGSSGGLGNFTAVEASAICNFETAKQRADGWSGAGKPRQGANASTSTSTANARGCSAVRCEGGGSRVEGGGVGWMRVCVCGSGVGAGTGMLLAVVQSSVQTFVLFRATGANV
jgi:hypothetical protein